MPLKVLGNRHYDFLRNEVCLFLLGELTDLTEAGETTGRPSPPLVMRTLTSSPLRT